MLQGYGFLAVFAAAVAVRGSERFHDYHRELHHFVEQVERLLTVLVLLLLGMALTDGLLSAIGVEEVVVAALLLLVVRPLVGALALRRSCGTRAEHRAMAFFGVRGIGSVYYVAYALSHGEFAGSDTVWAVVGLVIAGSVRAARHHRRTDHACALRGRVPLARRRSARPAVPRLTPVSAPSVLRLRPGQRHRPC